MKAHCIESDLTETEIVHIEYDITKLIISVRMENKIKNVTFNNPEGFRVLDEGNLLEYWPECSTKNGWLFKIESGGWLSQESQRSGFLLKEQKEIMEFFITGLNYCVNVFAWEHPNVEQSQR